MYHLAVIDDNESWCFVIASVLRQQGYIVSTYTDVSDFLRHAAQFDLALVDFSMPPKRYLLGMDGPEVIHKLKQELSDPPLLILISSFFTDDLLKQAFNLCPQADACLSKGTSSAELLHEIERLLASKHGFNSVVTSQEYQSR
jgi:CheY-like chemotaxis protein